MPESQTPTPKPRKKRKWLRRTLWGFLWFFMVLLVFHRPIIHHGGRWAAIYVAKTQNLALDLQIEGNLWGEIRIHDLKATATGPAPLEKLTLDRVAVKYDILKLAKGDLSGLESLEVGTVDAIVTPQPPKETKPAEPLATTIRSLLAKPLPVPKVSITRVDVRVKGTPSDVVVRNFHLALTPGSPGKLGWDRIEVPGLPPFEAATATTAFASGSLQITESKPDGTALDLQVKPASSGNAGIIAVTLDAFGFHLGVTAAPALTGNAMQASVQLDRLDVQPVARKFGQEIPIAAKVAKLAVAFAGEPENPATWAVDVQTSASASDLPGDAQVELQTALKQGVLHLTKLDVAASGATFQAKGELPIPPALLTGSPALPVDGTLTFSLAAKDLAQLGALLKLPLSGSLTGTGAATVKDGLLSLDLGLDGDALAHKPASIAKTSVKLHATQDMRTIHSLQSLAAELTVAATQLGTDAMQADSLHLTASVKDLRAEVRELKVQRAQSEVTAKASAKLTAQGKLADAPVAEFTILVPAIADFKLEASGQPVTGAVSGLGKFTLGEPFEASQGNVQLKATALRIGDAPLGEVEFEAELAKGEVNAKAITARLAGNTTLDGTARFTLASPNAYTVNLALVAPQLAAFEPVLAAFGQKKPLGGSLNLRVEGSGDLTKPVGTVKLDAKEVRFDTTLINEARITARADMTSAEISELAVTMDKLRATARIDWKDQRVSLSNLDVRLDGSPVLTGSLSAPLDPLAPKPIAEDGKLEASITAKELDVAKLLTSLGKPATAAGTVSAALTIGGSLSAPSLKLETKGAKLRMLPPPEKETHKTIARKSTAAPEPIPPTDFDATVTLEGNKLEVKGDVRQPLLQPLTFASGITLDVPSILKGEAFDYKTLPIKADVGLKASALDFLPKLVPALRQVEGTASLAITAGGTIGKPEITGSTEIILKTLRLADRTLPVVTDFKSRLNFAGNKLTFTEFGGELGGGRFALTGNIDLAKPAEPAFELALKSKDLLVMRDDTVLIRLETDLALRGPLNTAAATGTIYITESRFNKEIDILPLSLPGKPKPVPKAVAQPVNISFPQPPLRDWKFDIAVKTRENDPFLVRGNLAKGQVAVDVRLAGTGLAPYLTGAASITQFSAKLPLSTLTTRRGLVTFSQEAPFQPFVELEAESRVRQYVVVARIYGPATKPTLDLESEPPLPQQEILSLLTTGSLTGEIGANNTALATRAAVLVVQGWYKKLFKKDFPLSENDGGESLLDRFELDLGAVDPKTGRNEASAQFRATDNLFFIGDLELGGGVSGRVKYVFRFH